MPSRAREKELAKQAARRQAERRAAKKRRNVVLGSIGAVAGLALIVVGIMALTGGDEATEATPTPSASASASSSPSEGPDAKGEPQQTGTVTPLVEPPAEVACGGTRPDAASEPKPQFDRAPKPGAVLTEGADYTATIATSCGTFEVDLHEEQAPKAVASFVFLAEQGYFDGLTFHRVVPDFVIQGGDPLGNGSGGPGYSFADEFDPELRFDHAGALAMANSGPATNGSQWFVTLADDTATHLNDVHTIFGDVTEGLDVVEGIGALELDPATGGPAQAVYIDSVTISEG
jgi:cyclophilin family peptidyl-prolyl cis-trans isomerase